MPFNRTFRKNLDRPPKHTAEINRILNSILSSPVEAFRSPFLESTTNRRFDVASERPEALEVTKARYPRRAPGIFVQAQIASNIGHEPNFRSSNRNETY